MPRIEFQCPFCGSDEEARGYGLDIQGGQLVWEPCCEPVRDEVERFGWMAVWGASLRETVLITLGVRHGG